jgi:hypothetical protein
VTAKMTATAADVAALYRTALDAKAMSPGGVPRRFVPSSGRVDLEDAHARISSLDGPVSDAGR